MTRGWFGFGALTTLVACARNAGTRATQTGSRVGDLALSYDLHVVGGGSDGVARHHGRVVIANLWASWCPPCKAEMPALERLWRERRSRGVVVLGINQGESSNVAAAYAHKLGITFPILVDTEQRYGSSYVVIGLPTTIVVNRRGVIVQRIDGQADYARFRAAAVGVGNGGE